MLAALGGQLCRDNFGVILVNNNNSGLINSGVLFKVKQDLKFGFGSFGFVCSSTCTCVMLQLLAPKLHTAVFHFGIAVFTAG